MKPLTIWLAVFAIFFLISVYMGEQEKANVFLFLTTLICILKSVVSEIKGKQ